MFTRRVILTIVLALIFPIASFAQNTDVEGSKDHPIVPRLGGGQYFIGGYDQQGLANHAFTTADGEKEVEGKYWTIEYWLKEGGKKYGPLEIVRNYKNAVTKQKGQAIYERADTDTAEATLRLPLSGHNLWIDVDVTNGGELYRLTLIEEAGLVQNVELTSAVMSAALASTGTVTIRGILFDTAKAAIKDESAPVLAEIAKVLEGDPALRLEIQGHTDNVGAPAANLALSRQRADAVKAWLVSRHSVEAARLTTSGLGDTKPVADNKTEDGRAQNRRVELVKK